MRWGPAAVESGLPGGWIRRPCTSIGSVPDQKLRISGLKLGVIMYKNCETESIGILQFVDDTASLSYGGAPHGFRPNGGAVQIGPDIPFEYGVSSLFV